MPLVGGGELKAITRQKKCKTLLLLPACTRRSGWYTHAGMTRNLLTCQGTWCTWYDTQYLMVVHIILSVVLLLYTRYKVPGCSIPCTRYHVMPSARIMLGPRATKGSFNLLPGVTS